MRIYIGADHRGFALKEQLKKYLAREGYEVVDKGNAQYDAEDDYPDYAKEVAEQVSGAPDARGILICGSGAGVAIVANKFKGIRAATITHAEQARMARSDEDINILALPADFLDEKTAQEIVQVFLTTAFSAAERHLRRIAKISSLR